MKALRLGGAAATLSRALDPPSAAAVVGACATLRGLGALDESEELTALGWQLAALPVDPRLGKMLLLSVVLQCVGPVLTIAASLSGRSPFVAPLHAKAEANAAKRRLAGPLTSDHLLLVAAYNSWAAALRSPAGGGVAAAERFAADHFLSYGALTTISKTRGQFAGLLRDLGFDLPGGGDGPAENRHSGNLALVKAVMVAGLMPNVLRA